MRNEMKLRCIDAITALSLFFHCSRDLPVASLEPLDGNCVGTVKDGTGAPISGVSVLLVPATYTPLSSDSGGRIDSTFSDGYGRYAFSVNRTGSFNILSNGNDRFALRRSVLISAETRVDLDDEILRKPGSLKGTVHLQGMTDHQSAFVLFIGTNRFAAPSDTTGGITVDALAPGTYKLRILTTANGFAAVETTVVVTSDSITRMPVIELSRPYIPVVDSFFVNYDAAMMTVTLAWKPLDTTRIAGYNLYLNRATNPQPCTTLADTCSSLKLEVIDSPVDSFVYHISAIGNDGIPGPAAAGSPFVKNCPVKLVKTMEYRSVVGRFSRPNVAFKDGNMYDFIYDYDGGVASIFKTDSNGVITDFYRFTDTVGVSFLQTKVDEEGNVFALVRMGHVQAPVISMIRFDRDLNIRSETALDTVIGNYSFILCGNGSLVLISEYFNDDPRAVVVYATKYDSNFGKLDKRKLADNWIDYSPDSAGQLFWYIDYYLDAVHSAYNNDTVFCMVDRDPRDPQYFNHMEVLQSIDNVLVSLFSPKTTVFVDKTIPGSYGLREEDGFDGFISLDFSPRGIFMVRASTFVEPHPVTLSFFNMNNELIARMPWQDREGDLFFDSEGNFYAIKQIIHTNATIYKYSTEALFRKKSP